MNRTEYRQATSDYTEAPDSISGEEPEERFYANDRPSAPSGRGLIAHFMSVTPAAEGQDAQAMFRRGEIAEQNGSAAAANALQSIEEILQNGSRGSPTSRALQYKALAANMPSYSSEAQKAIYDAINTYADHFILGDGADPHSLEARIAYSAARDAFGFAVQAGKVSERDRPLSQQLANAQAMMGLQFARGPRYDRPIGKDVVTNVEPTVARSGGGDRTVNLSGWSGGEQVPLGQMRYDLQDSLASVDRYHINPPYQRQGLSAQLFKGAIDDSGGLINKFEGVPGDTNRAVYDATRDIQQTPWARTLDKLRFHTTYDAPMETMHSVRRP